LATDAGESKGNVGKSFFIVVVRNDAGVHLDSIMADDVGEDLKAKFGGEGEEAGGGVLLYAGYAG
jgi:hypothetical protein